MNSNRETGGFFFSFLFLYVFQIRMYNWVLNLRFLMHGSLLFHGAALEVV